MSKVCSINSVISKGSLIINEGGLISSRSVRSGFFEYFNQSTTDTRKENLKK